MPWMLDKIHLFGAVQGFSSLGEIIMLDDDFIRACTNGDLSKVKALLKQGANTHAWDDEALRRAAEQGHLNVANFLREVAGLKYKCHECLIKSTCLKLCEDFRAGEK